MKVALLALLFASTAAFGGTWAAHRIIPFGPLQGRPAQPGSLTIAWGTPPDERTQSPFAIDHYVLVYEDENFTVGFISGIPASANSYTLSGLRSGAVYHVWLEAHGDGSAVTPLLTLTAP
jgi:hypothetical protein